ncbi:tRNA preQ1(34) S-adenosylmethionine ribosyltransferase-isomerase QueA [Spirulina subsalsa]|uniref:tRNA preQ1(34) S-adenosylmethionine ribosyltransferase-isomerase QueA n=1 Tax=Spirulina subsalsa TaxID=54311 RepID=UPI00030A4702|nr:tRNA preQ1(34) S-adenosylmethionine ribosyltransferase-isomerase QueA [Spirulina subsalsa]
MTIDQYLSSYQYELPQELIAQNPAVPRDSSRLLVVDSPKTHAHTVFKDIVDWLQPGDLLVLNNTRVIPARLYGRKSTGAPVEILLLHEVRENCWLCLVKPGKRFKIGSEICFKFSPDDGRTDSPSIWARVIERDDATGGRLLEFQVPDGSSLIDLVARVGHVPLPPYITATEADADQYQTVYARELGSAAAPTAGLHFTKELLEKIAAKGVSMTNITLHIGVGTFRPVEVEEINQHKMHSEWLEINAETVKKIQETRAAGGRVIAVGTTAVRALEGAATAQGVSGAVPAKRYLVEPFRDRTDLFIYPGYEWKVVDGMITNFHLPGSSLLILVSSLLGRERLLKLYEEAIAEKYRFYSFGDAMYITPEAAVGLTGVTETVTEVDEEE